MYEERNLVSMIQLQLRISKFFVGFFFVEAFETFKKDSLFNSGKSTRVEETRVFNFTINEYNEFEYFYFNLFRSNVCRFVSIVS